MNIQELEKEIRLINSNPNTENVIAIIKEQIKKQDTNDLALTSLIENQF
jgi:hypothetical protein